MSLVAAAEKSTYLLGEPVWIYVVLENASSESHRVFEKLRPQEAAVTVYVGQEGEETRFSPLGHSDDDETAFVEISPGEKLGDTFPVFFGSHGWTFSKPGDYALRVVYETPLASGGIGRVSSETFPLRVTDHEAGARLVSGDETSLEAGKFLLWQAGDHLAKGRQLLSEIAARPLDSQLSSHANWALGRSLSEPFSDYIRNEVRPADCETAMMHLEQVQPGALGLLALVQSEVADARCLAEQQDFAGASASLDRAREIAGGVPQLQRLLDRIGDYERNLAPLLGS